LNNTKNDPTYYFEKAPVPKAILHMALPMIMGMILDLVYNIVDAFFVGRLGNTAMLAAITLAFPFFIVLMGVGREESRGSQEGLCPSYRQYCASWGP
jgi:multidrug efflux pump